MDGLRLSGALECQKGAAVPKSAAPCQDCAERLPSCPPCPVSDLWCCRKVAATGYGIAIHSFHMDCRPWPAIVTTATAASAAISTRTLVTARQRTMASTTVTRCRPRLTQRTMGRPSLPKLGSDRSRSSTSSAATTPTVGQSGRQCQICRSTTRSSRRVEPHSIRFSIRGSHQPPNANGRHQ